jgi:hypothetical protein
MIIKYILSTIVTFIGLYSWIKLERTPLVRGAILILFSALIASVFIPESTTVIANHFGVHRGADFMFYLAFLIAFFCIIFLYKKNRQLEKNLTQLARDIAIQRSSNQEKENSIL